MGIHEVDHEQGMRFTENSCAVQRDRNIEAVQNGADMKGHVLMREMRRETERNRERCKEGESWGGRRGWTRGRKKKIKWKKSKYIYQKHIWYSSINQSLEHSSWKAGSSRQLPRLGSGNHDTETIWSLCCC